MMDPLPEELLDMIRVRLFDPTHSAHERRVSVGHFAGAVAMFDDVLAEFRRARREPGKDEL